MHFTFDEDQEEFRASLAKFLDTRVPRERLREVVDVAGVDLDLWADLATELGVAGMHVPEELGGAGFSYEETAVVMQELGRRLVPVPLAATLFAIEALLRCGSPEQQQRWVPELASGERIGTLAVTSGHDLVAGRTPLAARREGAGWFLDGVLPTVVHGAAAHLLVVPAAVDGSVELFVVERDAEGVQVTDARSLDLARPVAAVSVTATPAVRLELGGDLRRQQQVLDVARVLLAFEAVGSTEAALAGAVEYARTRHQFNRAIGSFQAIKHKLADVAIELDACHGPAMYAVMQVSQDRDADITEAALVAKAQASETLRRAAAEMIQVLGGIGFTWEHDAHLFFRRAKAVEWWLGTPGQLRSQLADRVIA